MTSVNRRLAAIVAADVAGYSRLIGAFEEDTITQLRAFRDEVFEPKLAPYQGRIANTAGDSLLLEFASAVDALRFCLEVQAELAERNQSIAPERRLEFRMGINVGDVVASGDDLLGDGVNVAARIEALAQPGEICISRTARDQVRDRMEIGLEDLGEIEVKNIARPVRVFRVTTDNSIVPTMSTDGTSRMDRRKQLIATAMIVLAVSAGAWWWMQPLDRPPGRTQESLQQMTKQPTIAVLPFANLSGKQSESYFANGITEDLTTDLASVDGLSVTSSNAVARLLDNSNDLTEIAQQLGVGHLIEGSVRRSEDRIRITAKLIDAKTGNQLWAERFDRNSQDIFKIQDEITSRVISQLSQIFQTNKLATKKRSYTPNALAYDYYIKGRAQRIPPTPANLKSAFESFNRAIEIDPNFAGGYAGASVATILATSDSTTTPASVKAGLARAKELAEKAVELDPEFGPGWSSLAEVYLRIGRFDESLEAIQKAVRLAPSDSLMRANYGRYLGYVGRPMEGIEQIRQAMRMSPDSLPLLYFLGANQRAAGQFEAAIDSLVEHRGRLGGRVLPAPTIQLIAAYSQAGKLAEAKEAIDLLLARTPDFTISRAAAIHQYKDPQDNQKFIQALQEAGLPQ